MDLTGLDAAQRVGVISIAPRLPDLSGKPFDTFYEAIGRNSGNFMFTVAMYRQLSGTVDQIGFGFDTDHVNRSYDTVVIPCANWLNTYSDWDWLSERLDRLEIPIVPIGLGLQAGSTDDPAGAAINASCLRLARIFARKAKFISVRGDFTAGFLRSIGIKNTVTTGCPSIYLKLGTSHAPDAPGKGLVLQSTRYGMAPAFLAAEGINRDLFRIAAERGADIVFQSEPEEIRYLTSGDPAELMPERDPTLLARLYGFSTVDQLAAYLEDHGRFFVDIDVWSDYMRTRAANVGSRLHGTILSLNSGVMATLIPHDSRTSEVADFAQLPTARPEKLTAIDGPMAADHSAFARYVDTRDKNGQTYREFLRECGLGYRESVLF